MNWFYAKDGQQIGPLQFSEIERLRAEGQLTDDTLVWQQGMANWFSSPAFRSLAAEELVMEKPVGSSGESSLTPTPPQPLSSARRHCPTTAICSVGESSAFSCPVPASPYTSRLSSFMSLNLARSAKRSLPDDSKRLTTARFYPALFILGLVCCGGICYPSLCISKPHRLFQTSALRGLGAIIALF